MMYALVALGLLLVGVALWLLRLWSVASAEVGRRWEAEAQRVEQAPWFGQTGLPDEAERELPRYLRREFGEVGAPDGLKASDLAYLGILSDERGPAHFWRIPNRSGEGAYAHAYVEIDESGAPACYGWGDREPPPAPPEPQHP